MRFNLDMPWEVTRFVVWQVEYAIWNFTKDLSRQLKATIQDISTIDARKEVIQLLDTIFWVRNENINTAQHTDDELAVLLVKITEKLWLE